MSNHLSGQLATLRHNEHGQIGILMVMVLPAIFLIFALALDTGLWFLDHRIAQNQADAAVLAGVLHLPDADPGLATDAVYLWLEKNGSNSDQLNSCPQSTPAPTLEVRPGLEFFDLHPALMPDGQYEMVRVCIRRKSPGIFVQLANLDFIFVSAGAKARTGHAGIATVLPWGIVPPDTECDEWGEDCDNEYGDYCGPFPPVPLGEDSCPWGLHADKLYTFKVSDPDTYTPGNFGALASCGGGINQYKKCITGETNSGFYVEEGTVEVGAQTGDGGGATRQLRWMLATPTRIL